MVIFFIGLLIISFLVATMGCAEWNRTAKGTAIVADGAAGVSSANLKKGNLSFIVQWFR